jgi:hypothetical protein
MQDVESLLAVLPERCVCATYTILPLYRLVLNASNAYLDGSTPWHTRRLQAAIRGSVAPEQLSELTEVALSLGKAPQLRFMKRIRQPIALEPPLLMSEAIAGLIDYRNGQLGDDDSGCFQPIHVPAGVAVVDASVLNQLFDSSNRMGLPGTLHRCVVDC